MTGIAIPHTDAHADPVHELANVFNVIQTSVGYLLAVCPLPGETQEVVVDLQVCVERFPELLKRLRAISQIR